ncbi:MAG: TfoX/Sxy family DNA transformation protein [Burkholderiales bacterium]
MTKRSRVSGKSTQQPVAFGELINLSPESSLLLEQVGIEDRRKLEELGSVGAYVEIHRKGLRPTLNLLYALEGALRNMPWTNLPYHVRASLTLEADAILGSEGRA